MEYRYETLLRNAIYVLWESTDGSVPINSEEFCGYLHDAIGILPQEYIDLMEIEGGLSK